MFDLVKASIQGFVKIVDKDTKEILVETHNDVLYGNISTALAYALIGNPSGMLGYMAFGNGAAYVTSEGTIKYKSSFGGLGSLAKQPEANLYNTVYVKKLSNDATAPANYLNTSNAYVPPSNTATNYEDIIADVTLDYSEVPTFAVSQGTEIQQTLIDNSSFVGTPTASTIAANANEFVFNEIGLFVGTTNIFAGNSTTTIDEVGLFTSLPPSFSTASNTESKLMITHVIFHPIQKSANRSLQILYTLRIQMGNSII